MSQTNAQRQRQYRQRHLKDFNAKHEALERFNHMVSYATKMTLKRLARCYGVTQRGMLEAVLADAERRLLQSLPNTQQDAYYDMQIMLRTNTEGNRPDLTDRDR